MAAFVMELSRKELEALMGNLDPESQATLLSDPQIKMSGEDREELDKAVLRGGDQAPQQSLAFSLP